MFSMLSGESPYRIQCNSSSNRSPYRIQCNNSFNRSPCRIQCYISSNRSPYRIQCNSIFSRSPYRVQCNSSSIRSLYKIQCFTLGSPSTTKVLLDAGADKDAVNSSNRNAFQIAVSIGQYDCIAVLKNHLPLQDVERFISDNDSCPISSIPAKLVKPVHQLITTVNIHPVKVRFMK